MSGGREKKKTEKKGFGKEDKLSEASFERLPLRAIRLDLTSANDDRRMMGWPVFGSEVN